MHYLTWLTHLKNEIDSVYTFIFIVFWNFFLDFGYKHMAALINSTDDPVFT